MNCELAGRERDSGKRSIRRSIKRNIKPNP
jgi:hypothetical protein